MSKAASQSELTKLLVRFWQAHCRELDAFERMVQGRAALMGRGDRSLHELIMPINYQRFHLDDLPDNEFPEERREIARIEELFLRFHREEISLEELRETSSRAYAVLTDYLEQARKFCTEQARRDGYVPGELWACVKEAWSQESKVPVNEEWLKNPCAGGDGRDTGSVAAFLTDLARLERKGFAEMLRAKLQDRFPSKLAAIGLPPPPVSGSIKPPPLTNTEQNVLDLIRSLPVGEGITGKEIIAGLDRQGFTIDQSTLTTHVIPNLKVWHGVKNRPNVGYYIEAT